MGNLSSIVGLGTVVFTLINFIRYSFATNWSSAISQLLAWTAGILAAWITAHSDISNAILFGSKTLGNLNLWGQTLVGLAAASSIGVVYQFKRAIDGQDSAKVPSLQPPGRSNVSQTGSGPVGHDPVPEPVDESPVVRAQDETDSEDSSRGDR